jgi:hypothetical protein
LLVMGAGLYTIFSRLGVSPGAMEKVAAQVQGANPDEVNGAISGLDPGSMPCCAHEEAGAAVDE